MAATTPVTDHMDDDSDASFCSVKEIIEADTGNKDIIILMELIKHKNLVIKSQNQTIKSLQNQISTLTNLLTTSLNDEKNTSKTDNDVTVINNEPSKNKSKQSAVQARNTMPSIGGTTVVRHTNQQTKTNLAIRSQAQMESRNQTTSSAAVTSASVSTPSTSPSPAYDTDSSAGPWQRVQGRRTRKRSSLVIGAGSDNNVKGVAKRVSLHVSRIHPQTTLDEMETMIQ
nr:unnamed protein product [Callosobruchus chinensis]